MGKSNLNNQTGATYFADSQANTEDLTKNIGEATIPSLHSHRVKVIGGKKEKKAVEINSKGDSRFALEGEVASISKSDQYSLIAIFSILGGSLLMSSLDLLSMYLSIELQSFALYILATLNKDSLSATSAGLKYFLLGSLSSCFILLGSAIIYSYTGLTQFEAINSLISVPYFNNMDAISFLSPMGSEAAYPRFADGLAVASNVINSQSNIHVLAGTGFNLLIEMLDINKAFTIGLIIILIGFLFKISAAPFYQ
jgi:NADH:ubiquinone oxidoreductase subunit 2 (subunit N)